MSRERRPKIMGKDMWNQLVDYFCTDEHKKLSDTNTENRSKQKYQSLHGSRSYAQGRNVAGEDTNYIDHWFKMHCKKGVWVNLEAEVDWGVIQHELQRMQTVAEEGGEPMDELQCLKNMLGPRHGHTVGVGRQVKYPLPFGHLVAGGSSSRAAGDEQFVQLEEEMQKMREEMREIKKMQGRSQEVEEEDGGDDA